MSRLHRSLRSYLRLLGLFEEAEKQFPRVSIHNKTVMKPKFVGGKKISAIGQESFSHYMCHFLTSMSSNCNCDKTLWT